jgi:hypothetical protein
MSLWFVHVSCEKQFLSMIKRRRKKKENEERNQKEYQFIVNINGVFSQKTKKSGESLVEKMTRFLLCVDLYLTRLARSLFSWAWNRMTLQGMGMKSYFGKTVHNHSLLSQVLSRRFNNDPKFVKNYQRWQEL